MYSEQCTLQYCMHIKYAHKNLEVLTHIIKKSWPQSPKLSIPMYIFMDLTA